MAETLKIPNFTDLNTKERTTLAIDAAVGATSLTLTNNQNIAIGDFIAIGQAGSDTTEIVTVQGVTGATLATTTPLTLRHDSYDSVVALVGSQIKLYRAANINGTAPADSFFSSIGAAISIDPDQKMTVVTDPTGGSDFWYKFAYYNPTTQFETSLGAGIASRGGNIGNYASIADIRKEAGYENNYNISDDEVDVQRQAAQAYINGQLSGVYTVPFTPPINPQVIKATRLIAAGYLKNEQSIYSTNPGDKLIKDGTDIVTMIKSGQLVLIGSDGSNSESTTDSNHFSGYPNGQTAANGGGDFKFTVNDRY